MSYNPTRLTGLLGFVLGAVVTWILRPPEVPPVEPSNADIVAKFDDAVSASLAVTRATDELEKQSRAVRSLESQVRQLTTKVVEVPQVLPQVPEAEPEPRPTIRRFRH